MSIYSKLAEIQKALMGMKIPKTGKNNFSKYDYYELEDILPLIFKECYKQHTTLLFTIQSSEAVLYLKDWEVNTDYGCHDEIRVSVPLPPIEQLNKGMNKVQSEGAIITYLKRYLLVNTFLIMEEDLVDKDKTPAINVKSTSKLNPVEAKKETKKEEVDNSFTVPRYIKNAYNLCKKHNKEVNKQLISAELGGLRAKGLISHIEEEEYNKILASHYNEIIGVLQ